MGSKRNCSNLNSYTENWNSYDGKECNFRFGQRQQPKNLCWRRQKHGIFKHSNILFFFGCHKNECDGAQFNTFVIRNSIASHKKKRQNCMLSRAGHLDIEENCLKIACIFNHVLREWRNQNIKWFPDDCSGICMNELSYTKMRHVTTNWLDKYWDVV